MTSGTTSTTHKRRKTSGSDDGTVNLDVLDCKICFHPLTGSVYQCKNGHAVCGNCRRKLKSKCPTCRLQVDSRCRPLEEMMESVKVKCKNWDRGCKELLSYCNRDDHEKSCIHAKYLCHQPACKSREARHEEVRIGLLREKDLLSVKVSSLVAQSADFRRANQDLSETLSRREAELSARMSSLAAQNVDLGHANLGLTEELAFLRTRADVLRRKGSSLEAEKGALSAQVSSLKQSRAELQRVNGDLSSELAQVKDELVLQVATSESLHQGHDEMEAEMREQDRRAMRRQKRARDATVAAMVKGFSEIYGDEVHQYLGGEVVQACDKFLSELNTETFNTPPSSP